MNAHALECLATHRHERRWTKRPDADPGLPQLADAPASQAMRAPAPPLTRNDSSEPVPPDVPEQRARCDQRSTRACHEDAINRGRAGDEERDQRQDDTGQREDHEAGRKVDHVCTRIVRQRRRRDDRRALRSRSSRRAQPFSIARAMPTAIMSSHTYHHSTSACPNPCRMAAETSLPSRTGLSAGVGVGSGIGAMVAVPLPTGERGGRRGGAVKISGGLAASGRWAGVRVRCQIRAGWG